MSKLSLFTVYPFYDDLRNGWWLKWKFMAFLIKSWDPFPQDNVFHLSRASQSSFCQIWQNAFTERVRIWFLSAREWTACSWCSSRSACVPSGPRWSTWRQLKQTDYPSIEFIYWIYSTKLTGCVQLRNGIHGIIICTCFPYMFYSYFLCLFLGNAKLGESILKKRK